MTFMSLVKQRKTEYAASQRIWSIVISLGKRMKVMIISHDKVFGFNSVKPNWKCLEVLFSTWITYLPLFHLKAKLTNLTIKLKKKKSWNCVLYFPHVFFWFVCFFCAIGTKERWNRKTVTAFCEQNSQGVLHHFWHSEMSAVSDCRSCRKEDDQVEEPSLVPVQTGHVVKKLYNLK